MTTENTKRVFSPVFAGVISSSPKIIFDFFAGGTDVLPILIHEDQVCCRCHFKMLVDWVLRETWKSYEVTFFYRFDEG